jgi:hypothetical protein
MRLNRDCGIIGRLARFLILGIYWYMSCYFLMMDWTCPAYDTSLDAWTSESNYHMADTVRIPGGFSFSGPGACWANRVFQPLDTLVHELKSALGLKFVLVGQGTRILLFTIFGMAIILPFLFSLLVSCKKPASGHWFRLWTSLVLAIWYCSLIVLYHLIRKDSVPTLLGKPVAVIGTAAAIWAFVRAGRGTWLTIAVPLAAAIVSGTVWLVVSL